ncbi:MAG: shikimate kinase [Proteobacteria bacterium]|nr:shikimate kinase [Pseudomonadota bacterium]
MKKIIALVGLMGVGKSTLGTKLANTLGYYFIDSDQEIEDREKKTINEIFAKNGEKYFREIEKNLISEIITRDENIILSLGGGAYINDETRRILKEKSLVIWITAPVNTILQRVGNKNNRPLLNNSNKRKTLEELAKKRYPIYGESDLKFDTNEESHEAIISKIIKYLKNQKNAK